MKLNTNRKIKRDKLKLEQQKKELSKALSKHDVIESCLKTKDNKGTHVIMSPVLKDKDDTFNENSLVIYMNRVPVDTELLDDHEVLASLCFSDPGEEEEEEEWK